MLELQHVVDGVKAAADSEGVRRKLESDAARSRRDGHDEAISALSSSSSSGGGGGSRESRENARFLREQRLETQSMIGHQDVAIDSLGVAVDRLGQMGKEVNLELKEQNLLLQGLDDDLDEAGNRMNAVMGSLAKLLKTKDGCMIWTIVLLFLILVLLIALVIWT